MAAETGKGSTPSEDTEDGSAVAPALLVPSMEFLPLVSAMRIGLAVAFGVSDVFEGVADIGVSGSTGDVVVSEEAFLLGVCGAS